jgi:hypothetical protein
MLGSVDKSQKASANSLANSAYNFLGFMPSPVFYGFVSALTGGQKSKWSMGALLYSTMVTMGILMPGLKKVLEREQGR